MHSQAMIHGDLKGVWVQTLVSALPSDFFGKANILITENRHACLADFRLPTLLLDPTNPLASSYSENVRTPQWTSPELLNSEQDNQPTVESDSYALGMVILEVLSGHVPFEQFGRQSVIIKVIGGKRPERPNGPEGAWFTDNLWEMLTLCWESQPESRPSIAAILELLEQVSGTWEPLSTEQ